MVKLWGVTAYYKWIIDNTQNNFIQSSRRSYYNLDSMKQEATYVLVLILNKML
jgi:hypothetical protein